MISRDFQKMFLFTDNGILISRFQIFSELVLESREFDLLLGQILPDGSRSAGLIDKFQGSTINVHKIIELVAEDSESKGMFEDSVRLYDLAKKHDKVIELLNKLLAQVIALPPIQESRRDRLQRQGNILISQDFFFRTSFKIIRFYEYFYTSC